MSNITKKDFGLVNGRMAGLYTLASESISASFTDFGASLVSLCVPDRSGKMRDVVLGYDDAAGYAQGSSSLGATVGRYAGRIGDSCFTLNGESIRLPANNGKNHLHGCFGKRFFDAERTDDGVVFTLISPDGEDGFPGELILKAFVSVESSTLRIRYEATTDRDTVLNITNHSYFNLNGGGDVKGHFLKLYSDSCTETDENLIPTGRLLSVHGTVLDHTEAKTVGSVIEAPELSNTRGLDHSFVLYSAEGMKTAAELSSPESGIRMICRTTQPTVQVYSAGFLDRDAAPCLKNGQKQKRFGGLAIETQHLPDSPNKPHFPSTLLKKGEVFSETTEFIFELF